MADDKENIAATLAAGMLGSGKISAADEAVRLYWEVYDALVQSEKDRAEAQKNQIEEMQRKATEAVAQLEQSRAAEQ